METMKNCKACGAEIAKCAKVCPKCGAKQKKHRFLWIVLAVVVLLGILGAIGGGDSKPTLVASNQNTAASQETAAEPTKDSFGVGDTVALDGVSVTLKSVSESQGANFVKPESGKVFVLCEFEIENNSGSDIAVSSIMSFEAYIDDYSTNMDVSAIMASDVGQLDGTVAAGKKMHGVIGYSAAVDWKDLEIKFTPNFWAGKDITFSYSK